MGGTLISDIAQESGSQQTRRWRDSNPRSLSRDSMFVTHRMPMRRPTSGTPMFRETARVCGRQAKNP
jgi:hypothetical protein